MTTKPVLVTGSTGYVGGRLVPKLLDSGYRVRALGRSIAKLQARPWARHPLVELARGDVLDYESLLEAAQGCRAAFYLVHSMVADPKGFTETDRTAAQNMARAAAEAGLEHIIYLGGLGSTEDPHLSQHLRSRHEVAEILQSGPVPATFLRAAMILGSGSASFEILRYLVDRLPVMITPRWVHNPVQPIAIRNVLNYLQGCLEHEETRGQTFDIGGPEVLTYRQLFDIYAEEAHLRRRLIIPVPVLTPTLSSYWIHLVTPVPASIARPLAEGLSNPVVCKDNRIRAIIPQELLDCRQTIRLALERVKQQQIDTCWMDAGAVVPPEWTSLWRHQLCRRHRSGVRLLGPDTGYPRRSLAAHHQDGRRDRLLFRQLFVAAAGLDRPTPGGDRVSRRPAPSCGTPGGRCPGFLAGPGGRAAPPPLIVGRNETAGGGRPGVSPYPARRRQGGT